MANAEPVPVSNTMSRWLITDLPLLVKEGSAAMLSIVPQGRVIRVRTFGATAICISICRSPPIWIAPRSKRSLLKVNRAVHDIVTRYRGSIAAEHGIGQLKRNELAHYKSAVEMDAMRAVKQALDPKGLMNPGKVL